VVSTCRDSRRPKGDRKQKIYANFGRYAYVLPLDAALRSLSNEDDLRGLYFAPASTACPAGANDSTGAPLPAGATCTTTNALGTVDFVGDQAHFLNTPGGGGGITKNANFLSSGLFNEPFATGSRMEYTDEFLVGYDRDFKGGIVASVRYIDRRLKRVIEDQSGSSVEQNNAGFPLFYVIGNPNAKQDIFVNPNELVFDQGVNFVPPTFQSAGITPPAGSSPTDTLPLDERYSAAYVAAGLPKACVDSSTGFPTPFVAFNQFSGFAAVTPGAPTNGSACFPALNTTTWSAPNPNFDPTKPEDPSKNPKFITKDDCTSLKQQNTPGACAAFGSEFYADGKPDTYKTPSVNTKRSNSKSAKPSRTAGLSA